jgi:ADP-ribose pyrophosphatase
MGQRPGPAGWITVVTQTYRMPDGTEVDWDIMAARDAVAVLALTENEQVILARQFRPGPGCVLNELPGGLVNEGETPLQAVNRELLEETGFVGTAHVVGHTWQGANIRRRKWAAVAVGCRKVTEPDLDHSEEFCETVVVSLHDFCRQLQSGELTDGWAGFVGLAHLGVLGRLDGRRKS